MTEAFQRTGASGISSGSPANGRESDRRPHGFRATASGSSGCRRPRGVHPYDEVSWERRDVVMTNWRDGSINFEQRGVEFPDFWSVNAANIVTTKYFRGAVGTDAREWSLRQLIDRVVHKYRGPARSTATSPRPPTPRSSSTS